MAFPVYGKLFRISQYFCVKNILKNFGSNLIWETNLEKGLQKVMGKQKPGMIVFHKSWCGACRGLKPKFEASKDIEKLSDDFVLISLADDNHPKDERYMPDGDYVPRIMFVNPQGMLLVEVINEGGSNEYKYFYSDAESIARSMRNVLSRSKIHSLPRESHIGHPSTGEFRRVKLTLGSVDTQLETFLLEQRLRSANCNTDTL